MVAVIDIGSNSVRLMLWADGKSLLKRVNTTRLGAGLDGGVLQSEAIERTALAVKAFAEEGRARGADVFAFATAAVRSAKNGAAFCTRVEALCGIKVDVVSGEEEALLGLRGALGEKREGGIIDIGGGSTEICLAKDGRICFSVSLNVGAVRLFDRCGENRMLLEREIEKELAPLGSQTASLPHSAVYAIGGTAATLACLKLGLKEYNAAEIQDLPMSEREIGGLADKLLSLDLGERRALAGMDPRRADIIGGGALLLEKIMQKLSLREIFASDRDNLEGYRTLRGLQ